MLCAAPLRAGRRNEEIAFLPCEVKIDRIRVEQPFHISQKSVNNHRVQQTGGATSFSLLSLRSCQYMIVDFIATNIVYY
jgi:hypothetical protein